MLNLLASGRGRADKLKVSKVFYVSLDTPSSFSAELADLAHRQRDRLRSRRIYPSGSFLASGCWVGGMKAGPGDSGPPPKGLLRRGLAS